MMTSEVFHAMGMQKRNQVIVTMMLNILTSDQSALLATSCIIQAGQQLGIHA